MLSVIASVIACLLLALIGLSIYSRFSASYGLEHGRLKPCESALNCVNSEFPDNPAFIQAIQLKRGNHSELLLSAKKIIQDSGGEITLVEKDYIHAQFTSKLFKFVDDFEVRLDQNDQLLHLRSKSRVGRKDFGVNKKRVTAFKTKWSNLFLDKN